MDSSDPDRRGSHDRDRWEYRTLRPPREPTMKEAKDPTDALNDLGVDGWELADTIDYVGGGTKLLVLKRPAGSGPGTEAGEGPGTEAGDGPGDSNDPTPGEDHE